MVDASFTSGSSHPHGHTRHDRMPVSVQLLSTILFGAFAITAVAMAFNAFWPAGIVLAVLLGWRGGFVPQRSGIPSPEEIADRVRNLAPEAQHRQGGNSSFNAYRSDTLRRLEEEQQSFESFLDRLRAASDKHEFDKFMDERAEAARLARIEDAEPVDTAASAKQ